MQQHRLGEQGNFGRAECELSMMAQNHVDQQIAQRAGEAGDLPQLFFHDPQPDGDVPQQLAFRRITEAARITELVDLADVVKNDAGEQQIEIDVRVVRRSELRQVAEREDMLDQPSEPGMMHRFRRRSGPKGERDRFVREDRFEQRFEMRAGHRRNPGAELREHFVTIAFGCRKVIGEIDFRLRHRQKFVNRELLPVLKYLEQSLYAHKIVALESIQHFGRVLPHLGVELAGAIGERHRKIRFARFLLANIFVMHQEDPGDDLVRLELVYVG